MIEIRLREALAAYHERTGTRMTYQDLAAKTGLARSTLESIGSRQGYNATLEVVDRICTALACDLHDLLEYQAESSNDQE